MTRRQTTPTNLGADGSLTVSATRGHGTAVLPPEYLLKHVRLGYAATEHGYQGDTVTVGLELASAATTCRGLYSDSTRGTHENHILVVTEADDLAEAREVLERVLASERADVPATSQRRELAQLDRAPKAPRPEPRYLIPDWFDELLATVQRDLIDAEDRAARAEAERAVRQQAIEQMRQAAANAVTRGDAAAADAARTKLHQLRRIVKGVEILDRWTRSPNEVPELRNLAAALDDWKRWAGGHGLRDQRLAAMLATLTAADSPACAALAATLAPVVPAPTTEPPAIDLGIG